MELLCVSSRVRPVAGGDFLLGRGGVLKMPRGLSGKKLVSPRFGGSREFPCAPTLRKKGWKKTKKGGTRRVCQPHSPKSFTKHCDCPILYQSRYHLRSAREHADVIGR